MEGESERERAHCSPLAGASPEAPVAISSLLLRWWNKGRGCFPSPAASLKEEKETGIEKRKPRGRTARNRTGAGVKKGKPWNSQKEDEKNKKKLSFLLQRTEVFHHSTPFGMSKEPISPPLIVSPEKYMHWSVAVE